MGGTMEIWVVRAVRAVVGLNEAQGRSEGLELVWKFGKTSPPNHLRVVSTPVVLSVLPWILLAVSQLG